MLYSEFVEGTGCRENEHNYKVYKNLQVMYMNSDMSKQEIYEYGKKLVDNSDTPEQIAFKEHIKTEIKELQRELTNYRQQAKTYKEYYRQDKDIYWKNQASWNKQLADDIKRRISELKWILGGTV